MSALARSLGWLSLAAVLAAAASVHAKPPASATAPSPSAAPAAPPRAPSSAMPKPKLPPGHPDISGRMGASGMQGMMFRGRPNSITPDPSVPAGSVAVVVLDADENPVGKVPVALSYLRRSVQQGESRGQQQAVADDSGKHRFDELARGREISYRVSVARGRAQYGSKPFALGEEHGVRVVLHAYQSTSRSEEARLNVGAIIVVELDQDMLSVDHVLQVLNVGQISWVPEGVQLRLPPDHTAFRAGESMTGLVARPVGGDRVELSGTFPPGRSEISYGYRLPLASGSSRTLSASVPPQTTQARVVAAVIPGLQLQVEGFDPAQSSRSPDGKHILVTEKQLPIGSAGLGALRITLDGLPTPSSARWIAILLALLLGAVGVGSLWSARQRGARRQGERDDLTEAQQVLLEEVAELERARRDGAVVPEQYDAARIALVEALGRTVARLDETPRASRRHKRARRPAAR